MSETLVNTIDGDKLYAERAVKDASGNNISTTYATKSEIPVVDQSYDATSTNAQSGVAVAEALSNVPSSSLIAGGGIVINQDIISVKADGTSITYNSSGEIEAHNTLEAGGGIHIDTDYNTISVKADGTSITYNSSGEIEAHNTLEAGNGINIDTNYNVIEVKADGSTISFNASGELQATVSGGVTDVTVDGSSVVNAQGVAEITMPTFTQVNSDWNASSGVAEILNKPANLVQDANYVHTDENFTSAEKTKLSGIAAGAEVNVQADWNESSSSSDAYIRNKPTIPAAQVQSDWNQSDNTQVDFIKNKPTINNVPSVGSTDDGKALVAHYSGGSGSYSWDNLPSEIFPVEYGVTTYAQITDALTAGKLPVLKYVDSSTIVAVLSNIFGDYYFTSIRYSESSSSEILGVHCFRINSSNTWSFSYSGTSDFQADWNQTSSSFLGYIKNRPDLSIYAQSANLANVAFSGSYSDLSGTPTIPAAPVQSNWNETDTSSLAYIQNKPTIPTMELFEAVYGTTTYADITAAITAKKIVYCKVSPSGATRMAFLAYIGSNSVEFQYYRSLSSRSATNQLDEVYVYTVDANGWTTTTRKAGVSIAAGTGLTSSYASGTLTLSLDIAVADQEAF